MAKHLRLIILLAIAAVAFSLSACTPKNPETVPPTMSETTPSEPGSVLTKEELAGTQVVRIKSSGGMCAEGACPENFIEIYGDGKWSMTDESGDTGGQLSKTELDALLELVDSTDAKAYPKDEPFCESWVDGRDVELTYTTTTGDTTTASSCEYELTDVDLLVFVSELE